MPTVSYLLKAPEDWMNAYRAQAEEDGMELAEWIRQRCLDGLSKKRRKGLSEPIQRGRPKKQEGH
jgi:hypothetical protein